MLLKLGLPTGPPGLPNGDGVKETLPSLSKKGRGLEKNPGPGDPLKTTGETVELAAKKSFC